MSQSTGLPLYVLNQHNCRHSFKGISSACKCISTAKEFPHSHGQRAPVDQRDAVFNAKDGADKFGVISNEQILKILSAPVMDNWCEDCGQSHLGDCPVHGPLLKVRDKTIPTRARLTLPHYLVLKEIELRTSNKQVLGVFARKLIQQRTQFGPFIAPRVPKLETILPESTPVYKVFRKGAEVSTLDLSNENTCSWMMFVRTATTFEEQNLVAYQFNKEIFFASCKPVAPHSELKVWYASDYAHIMNVALLRADKPGVSEQQQSSSAECHVIDPVVDVKKTIPQLHIQDKNNNIANASSCEPWKCSNCNQMFGTFSLLEQHSCESSRVKQGRKPKIRKLQKRQIVRQSKLQINVGYHMEQDSKSTNTAVKKEPIPGSSKPRVRKEPMTFACHICSKVFLNPDKLKTHSYIHTGERPFPCTNSECSKAFISKYKLLRHMTTHSPMKVHICSYCDKKFHRKDHLKNHLQTHDPNKVSFRCGDCGKMYNTKPGFKKHIALHAAALGELTCKICDKDFGSTQSLLEHIKLHSGKSNGAKEKKHRCEHCDRQFYTRKDVRRHMVVHTGRKDFLCQVCGQRFGRKDHLVRHTRKSHDNNDQLQVKLGEHLQAVGSATVQQMLDMQQCQGQLHIPFSPGKLSQSSFGLPTSSDKLTDILKIPPVPTPKFSNKVSLKVHSPAKQTVTGVTMEKMMMDSAMDSGGLDIKNVVGDSLHSGSVDFGQLLGFLPMQQHQQIPATSLTSNNLPISPTLPQSPTTICQPHQHQLLPARQQQQQQAHHLQRQQQLQQMPTMQGDNPLHSPTETTNSSRMCTNLVQVPFTGLHSALPRFHHAFQ